MRRGLYAGALAGALLVAGPSALAQTSGHDVATAQALFEDGKRLMQQGEYADACPKLVESQRLDPGGGTLLAIALCHEGQGKTATAWADFNVALGQARKDGRADREATAVEHIKALEPKLLRVRILVEAKKDDGIEVLRDGALVGAAQWGTALPVDPGEHVFSARAAGKQPWTTTVNVEATGQTLDVRVPPLADAEIAPAVNAPAPPATREVRPEAPAPIEREGGSSQIVWAAAAGGIGLVATAVGAVFGISASSKWNDAERACPGGACTNAEDMKLGEEAGSAADASTVLFVVGGVGLAAGAILYLTAPRTSRTSAVRRLLVEGTF